MRGPITNMVRTASSALVCLLFLPVSGTQAADLPHFRAENGAEQLLVYGKPFLIRGGELGNSSAGTRAQADAILPAMARLHLNTVLMPVAWEQVEPKEGVFDFNILDHWIDAARQHRLHLVLFWKTCSPWRKALDAPEEWCSMRTARAQPNPWRWADMCLRRRYRAPGPPARCWQTTEACCCSSLSLMSFLSLAAA